MISMQDIDGVEDWLISQALGSPNLAEMFGEMCERLRACNVPVERALLAWTTLHPLVEAEVAFWELENGLHHERIGHNDEETEEWLKSPVRSVLMSPDDRLRRRLVKSNAPPEFPLLERLTSEGFTDYLILQTGFDLPSVRYEGADTGIIVSWATKEANGFADDALKAIHYIQKRLALAARATLEGQISRTVAETYLGSIAGSRVLNGQIRHGDGETIDAVIYFSDMRNSTSIAEDLGPDDYLKWLNVYFEATAGAVLDCGGEVLDFIGDAVLGVFPIGPKNLAACVEQAVAATDETRARLKSINSSGLHRHELKAGVALSVGSVMFGNIGVPNRLTFSVIGQTVHAAARIEGLTKSLNTDVLMTKDISVHLGDRVNSVGDFSLSGFARPQPLYSLK